MKRDMIVSSFCKALKKDKFLSQRKDEIIRDILATCELMNYMFPEEEIQEMNNVIDRFLQKQTFSEQARECNMSKKEIWKKYKVIEEFLGSIIAIVLIDYIAPMIGMIDDGDGISYHYVVAYLDKYRSKTRKHKRKNTIRR